jgi:mRNA-degrading endonuclease RelE of RelBE toxin-antitoxin system
MAFEIRYTKVFVENMKTIQRRHYPLIKKTIRKQLSFEPNVETKQRKPLERPSILPTAWELRFGPGNCFRVFYDIDEANRKVHVLIIGVKVKNSLHIGGKRFDLSIPGGEK